MFMHCLCRNSQCRTKAYGAIGKTKQTEATSQEGKSTLISAKEISAQSSISVAATTLSPASRYSHIYTSQRRWAPVYTSVNRSLRLFKLYKSCSWARYVYGPPHSRLIQTLSTSATSHWINPQLLRRPQRSNWSTSGNLYNFLIHIIRPPQAKVSSENIMNKRIYLSK